MEINIYLIHTVTIFIAVVIFYVKYRSAQRERALYDMYRVRDEFVRLVAEKKLKETDMIFSFYYKRINSLLQEAPNVGLEKLLDALLNNSKDFDLSLKINKEESEHILSGDQAKDIDIRLAIELYYQSVKFLMLSHSNLLKIIFTSAKHINPLNKIYNDLLPKNNTLISAFKVTQNADKRVSELHQNNLNAT